MAFYGIVVVVVVVAVVGGGVHSSTGSSHHCASGATGVNYIVVRLGRRCEVLVSCVRPGHPQVM